MEHVIASEDRYLVAVSRHVRAGEPVEVDEVTAASLRAQGWRSLRDVSAETAGEDDEPEPAVPAGDEDETVGGEPAATNDDEE